MGRMIRAALNNNWAEARELERASRGLFEANFWESNPCPVKDRAQPDGPLHRPRAPAAGAAHGATRARLERLAGELGLLKHIRKGKGDKMPPEDSGRAKNDEVWNLILYIRGLSKGQPAAPAQPAAAPPPPDAAPPQPAAVPAPPPTAPAQPDATTTQPPAAPAQPTN
jgi:pyruvate/2-oxoglutarate dehydrogenase complex dihydrolipoamide acyltransferase (E2) component